MSAPDVAAQPTAASVLAETDAAETKTYLWVFAAFGVLWLTVYLGLRGEWTTNSAYSYGVFVPFLSLYFLIRSWHNRPIPPALATATIPSGKRRRRSPRMLRPAPTLTPARRIILVLACAAAALLLPVRLMQEVNADWRFAGILHAALAFGISVALAFVLGGRHWVWHFLPVFVLMLLAVPWPDKIEQFVTGGLMQKVAAVTVDFLNDAGVAAVQKGNLIEVANGVVGIDEACSGVRSLQLCLALSYFLALLRNLRIGRGMVLAAAGVCIALTANLGRTFFLSLVQAQGGAEGLERWHDRAGVGELIFCLTALWFAAVFLTPRRAVPGREAPVQKPDVTLGPIPQQICLALCAWVVAAEVLTGSWYWAHERKEPVNVAWSVHFPEKAPRFRPVALSERIMRELRCDSARAAVWSDQNGNEWSGVYSEWKPGRPIARRSRVHRPENCFPAHGRPLRADLGTVRVTGTAVGDMVFRAYVFDHLSGSSNAQNLYVFYLVWENRPDKQIGTDEISPFPLFRTRLAAVREGLRTPEQRTLEFTLLGPPSAEAAREALTAALPHLLAKER